MRVLETTYGRIGRRRHELLAPYLAPNTPADDKMLEMALLKARGSVEQPVQDPEDKSLPTISSALRALANSQRKNAASARDRMFIARVDPVIPELNNKARPMPIKRVRNIKRQSYGALLQKIMPPLPKDEWERLRDLATAQIPWMGLPPRRSQATPWDEIEDYDQPVSAKYLWMWGGKHELSTRFMQRIWGRVFETCPLLWRDMKRDAWTVEWGQVQDKKAAVPEPSSGEAYMLGAMQGDRYNDKGGRVQGRRTEASANILPPTNVAIA